MTQTQTTHRIRATHIKQLRDLVGELLSLSDEHDAAGDEDVARAYRHAASRLAMKLSLLPALSISMCELVDIASGGIIRTDRGQGSAGPLYLGEGRDDLADSLDDVVEPVSEDDDPEAWRLAREALTALELPGEPEHVCLGEQSDDGYQAIYVA